MVDSQPTSKIALGALRGEHRVDGADLSTARRLVVWGAGELGGRVARRWVDAGGEALGFTEGGSRHGALAEAGVTPHLGSPADLVQPEDALLVSLPGTDRQILAVNALGGSPPPARVVLVSSTGYYGLASGIVDETTRPGSDGRAGRIAALETLFRAWAPEGVVLRIGGLYRPGRGPLAALSRRGAPPLGPPDKTLALIHYEDAATATFEALRHRDPRYVYVCVVPPCPTRQEFYFAATVMLSLDDPVFDHPLERPTVKYDTHRMREDLLPEPAHPRWQEALLP